ncbi:hypothetical protein [Citrobacter youngae]|uniref:hypothetical protein n=1 Tax=Citrobacter youngae TaxID=133448 RepID=UPI000517CF2F|nr:hypothetical protein [Citrobacter youngae]
MTANDQIHQAAWADSGNALMQEEHFTYDKNLNITRRQTWVNSVLESEAHQQQQHGRVISREYKGWRHSAHRINPETRKAEEGDLSALSGRTIPTGFLPINRAGYCVLSSGLPH